MSLILTALGWLTETFVAGLVQKAGDFAIQRWFRVEDGDGDGQTLNKLRDSLLTIQPIVSKVENMWIKDEILKRRVNELLLQLKEAAYDADDLLDKLQYPLQQQIEQQGVGASNLSSSSSCIPPRKKIKTSLSNATRSFFGKGYDKDDFIKVIKETQRRLDTIATDINERIAWIEANGRGKELMLSSVSRKTGSLVETRLFGRETELQELGGLLSKLEGGSNNSSISVVTIVGIGGVGKTTLVKEVYNNLVGVCFDCKFWVCVSEDFSVERLTREMIESTTGEKCDLMNFDKLQLSIKDKIASKRFLVVLDDVWDLDSQKWEKFCAPLTFGAQGSKILITTRFKNIADIVGIASPINLYGLDEKTFWEYFEKCTFISQNFEDYPELEAIAKKNIYKLKGLPLAARTLGGLLNQNMDKRHWEAVLESEIWKLQQKETDVLPVLQLSYQYLPTHLKRCFAFCSLFPKDFRFQERYLIQIWMAEDFVAPQENMRMEDIGRIYFRELVDRSFFQQSQYEGHYVIHDLLHDLAELISEGECYRIEGTKPHEIPSMIRHMSVFRTKLQELNSCNKLRTILISNFFYNPISLPVHTLFERLKRINVLILQSCCLQELPETIGNLVHLRFLDISYNPSLMKLPESLCNLYNLQTLILSNLPLRRLPHGMSKLINLRHLVVGEEMISAISEVGKLTSLQELSAFKVLKKHGHKIEELNHLTQLQGTLRIKNLENIVTEDEARKGKLKNKKYLEGLQLEWSPPYDTNLEKQQLIISEEVLEALEPHQSLKILTIKGYKGARSPSWLKPELLYNLKTLALLNCKWKDLSYIVQFQRLMRLHIDGIPGTKQISHQFCSHMGSKFFPMLEELHLEDISELEEIQNLGEFSCLRFVYIANMPSLKYISYPSRGPSEGKFFPVLKTIILENLPRLEELPYLGQLPCLKDFELRQLSSLKQLGPLFCDLTERNIFPMLQNLVLEDLLALEVIPNLGQLPSLKNLRIQGIPKLMIIGHGFFGAYKGKCFPCLKFLWLEGLTSWEEWSWPKDQVLFPCLDSFTILGCPKLKRLPPLPCSLGDLCLQEVGLTELPRLCKEIESNSSDITARLSVLSINRCPKLRSLEEGLLMHHLPNIKCIEIYECEELMRLPMKSFKELTSLERLAIRRCPKLMTQDEKFDLLQLSIKDLEFHG